MDEQEKIDKRAHVRLVVTEVLMFLAVLALVGFLTLVVLGYSFNLREIGGSGEVIERSGLLQVSSSPTGATILVDGETALLFNTNASRTLIAGEHEIKLEKEGFDTWSKKITIVEGMMYRLNYPRLFKNERETEDVLALKNVEFSSVSPNFEKMMLLTDGSMYMVNLNENEPTLKKLEILDKAGNVVKITTLVKAEWSGNSERVMAKVNGEWAVINVKDAKDTVWLSTILDAKTNVSSLKFETEAGDRLLMLNDERELSEIALKDGKVQKLLSGVFAFDNDGERVAFIAEATTEKGNEQTAEAEKAGEFLDTPVAQVRGYQVGAKESYLIDTLNGRDGEKATNFRVATMRYFQESYVAVARKNSSALSVYYKNGWMSGDGEMEPVKAGGGAIASAELNKRGKGMVFEQVSEDGSRSVFDIEAMKSSRIEAHEGEEGWIDEYLRYNIKDGKLTVSDYDGLNERTLVSSGVLSDRAVAISGNNRWLYYFTDSKLVREKLQ